MMCITVGQKRKVLAKEMSDKGSLSDEKNSGDRTVVNPFSKHTVCNTDFSFFFVQVLDKTSRPLFKTSS